MRIFLLLFLVVSLATTSAAAQTVTDAPTGGPEVIFWDIAGENAQALESEIVRTLGKTPAIHIVGAKALEAKLQAMSLQPPGCFSGLESCRSAFTLTTNALGLSSVIRVTIAGEAAAYRWLDQRGSTVREGAVKGKTNELAFGLLRDIFDATGTLTIRSTPSDAEVLLDGEVVGTTPLTQRLPVGTYRFVVRRSESQSKEITVELPNGVVSKDVDLDAVPGRLIVQDAPEGAEVFVNGSLAGKAGEPIELAPGNYTIEVRAEGYNTVTDAIVIEPGLAVNRAVPLQNSNFLLREVSTEAIAHRKYILRLGYEHGFQRATFQDGNTSDGAEFLGLVDASGGLPPSGRVDTDVNSDGLRVDASYTLGNFGLVLLSASYLIAAPNAKGLARINGENQPVEILISERLQVRPFQVFYRRFYNNFVPIAELGIGVDFHWFEAELEDGNTIEFSRSEAFWTLAFGAQYYFTNSFFAAARYSLQDYFTSGPGFDHQVGLGLGIGFSNLFGFDPEPPGKL